MGLIIALASFIGIGLQQSGGASDGCDGGSRRPPYASSARPARRRDALNVDLGLMISMGALVGLSGSICASSTPGGIRR
jgi:hypothetical protein